MSCQTGMFDGITEKELIVCLMSNVFVMCLFVSVCGIESEIQI